MKQFFMRVDSAIEPRAKAGTQVYPLVKADYGLARDDERNLGVPCRSFTLNPDGDYPGFVVRVDAIEVREVDTTAVKSYTACVEALKPFAALYQSYMNGWRDDRPVFGIDGNNITVGELRRACNLTKGV